MAHDDKLPNQFRTLRFHPLFDFIKFSNISDYFIEVSDQEFIENAYDEYDVADNASDLVDTVFESLTDLAVSTAIDPEHEEIAKEKLEQKKTEIKAALNAD